MSILKVYVQAALALVGVEKQYVSVYFDILFFIKKIRIYLID